ncbi:MAG: excinuclease ABC subunit UvrA, partial [Planctomycetota bacterium]
VLWARAGTPRCPKHGLELAKVDPARIARDVLKRHGGAKGWIVAPMRGPEDGGETLDKERLEKLVDAWKSAGFVRLLVDGAEVRLDGKLPKLGANARVDLVIDRLGFSTDSRARIAEAAEQAAAQAHGRVSVVVAAGPRLEYSTQGACPECGHRLEHRLDPRHFSFNTHAGACPECDGLGSSSRCDAAKLVVHEDRSLLEDALHPKFARYLVKGKGYYEHLFLTVARTHKIKVELAFGNLTQSQQDLLLHGKGAKPRYEVKIERESTNAEIQERFTADWPGLCGHIDAWHRKTEDAEWATLLEQVMTTVTCPTCEGERLMPDARHAVVAGVRLPEMARWSVSRSLEWLRKLALPAATREGVEQVVGELVSRLSLLERVGLGYLTLDRPTHTLSGGEARRVRLSANLGSQLVGVCYVLDEPTVGLHPADVEKLTGALLELRTGGNSVLVVEHDESLMRRADWIVDMGPGAGRLGGKVVASCTPGEIESHPSSLTGAALRGELAPARNLERTKEREKRAKIRLTGASGNNLKGVDFEARFGAINGVCGPSGSGKSTLVLDTLVPALKGE